MHRAASNWRSRLLRFATASRRRLESYHPDPECDLDCIPLFGREQPLEHALKLSIAFGGHLAAVALRRWDGREACSARNSAARAA